MWLKTEPQAQGEAQDVPFKRIFYHSRASRLVRTRRGPIFHISQFFHTFHNNHLAMTAGRFGRLAIHSRLTGHERIAIVEISSTEDTLLQEVFAQYTIPVRTPQLHLSLRK